MSFRGAAMDSSVVTFHPIPVSGLCATMVIEGASIPFVFFRDSKTIVLFLSSLSRAGKPYKYRKAVNKHNWRPSFARTVFAFVKFSQTLIMLSVVAYVPPPHFVAYAL